jgi:PBP1b-binding outer membrane lipoprotein LpoB
MAIDKVFLRPVDTFGASEACRLKCIGFGLISLGLAMFAGCASEADVNSGATETKPVMQVNSADVFTMSQGSYVQTLSMKDERVKTVSADASTAAPQGDFQPVPAGTEQIMQVDSANLPAVDADAYVQTVPVEGERLPVSSDASTAAPQGDFQPVPAGTEQIMQVDSANLPMPPQEHFESGPVEAQLMHVTPAGEMEDVMTVTPKGGFEKELTEAEPIYSPI